MSSFSLSPRMEEFCDRLRRNDPSEREVDGSYFCSDHARYFCEALRGNTQVDSLRLNVSYLADNDITNENAAPLLQLLRTNSTLGTVKIDTSYSSLRSSASEPRRDLVEQCLLAIADNAGTSIKTLVLRIKDDYQVPTSAFVALIRNTKSIQTLDVSLSRFEDLATPEELESLRVAVLRNNSIHEIHLYWQYSTVISKALVTYLGCHSCLQVLKLCKFCHEPTMSQMQALTYMLSETKTLERLKLCFRFNSKEVMDCLVEGLKANKTLIELSFPHEFVLNTFSTEAKQSLAEYMQSPKQGHSIRELLLSPWSFEPDDDEYGAFVVSMLAVTSQDNERHNNKSPSSTSPTVASPTVGSSLKLLEFSAGPDETFYRAFAKQAARIYLHSLKIKRQMLHFESFHALLPQLIHLREFIAPSDGYAEPVAFVRALKTNGSLSNVTIDDANRDLSQEPFKCLIKAYCQRNATLPSLLSKIQGDDDSGDGSLGDNTRAGSGTSLSRLPTLFLAALQASVTTPKLVLTGLLSAGEHLNELSSGKSDNKRVLSESVATATIVATTEASDSNCIPTDELLASMEVELLSIAQQNEVLFGEHERRYSRIQALLADRYVDITAHAATRHEKVELPSTVSPTMWLQWFVNLYDQNVDLSACAIEKDESNDESTDAVSSRSFEGCIKSALNEARDIVDKNKGLSKTYRELLGDVARAYPDVADTVKAIGLPTHGNVLGWVMELAKQNSQLKKGIEELSAVNDAVKANEAADKAMKEADKAKNQAKKMKKEAEATLAAFCGRHGSL